MKPPIKSPYESSEDFQERQQDYDRYIATMRMAYALAAISGIVLGLLIVAVNYIWPR